MRTRIENRRRISLWGLKSALHSVPPKDELYDVLKRSSPAVGRRYLGEGVQFGSEVLPVFGFGVQPDYPFGTVGAKAGLGVTPEVAGDVCVESRVRVMDELERLQDAGAVNGI